MTKRRRQVPGLGWAGAPFALLAAIVGWTMMINGCPSQVSSAPEGQDTTAEREVEHFQLVRDVGQDGPAPVDPAQLLEQALAGIQDGAGDGLGSRMQVRDVRIPSPPRGATSRFNFDGGKRGWITALPSAHLLTTPAFSDGKVYLGGGFASHRFFAFDAYDGELSWTVSAPDGGPTAAIVYKNRVIFNTESCTIFVADVETGELLWKRWLGDPLMSQATAADDLVMSAYPKNGSHEFGAFRITDGEPAWTISIPADIIQAPQVVGNDVFFTTMDGTAHRVRVRDGHVLWARDVGASSAVWVDGDHVLLSARVDRGGRPHEQPIVLDTASGRVSRRGEMLDAPYLSGDSRDRQLAQHQMGAWGNVPHGDHLGLSNIAAGWAFQGSSPAIADGRAYFAIAGEIRARDIATAEEVWTRSYGAAEGAQSISPPAVVGSQIFFGTLEGHVYAADIDTGMIQWAYDIGEPIVFQPIVAQGWIYLATGEGNLIGLEIGDHRVDGWHMWGGNAQHRGLVETAGDVDPRLLASLDRPGRGTMRVGRFEEPEGDETATDATPAPANASNGDDDGEAESAMPVDTDLPLVATRVEGTVSGMVARVNVTQSFTNPHDRPIEAIYLFPLPADSAVDDMEMVIGDRIIRGQIKRRAQARQVYEEARSEGRRAALLEQQRPNLFAQRVANIGPGETIEVRLSYVQALPFEDGAYELVYPMVAPPRHDPSEPGSVIAPTGVVREPNAISLDLTIDAGLPLGNIASPTHDIAIARNGSRGATVRLESPGETELQDFVLRYEVSGDAPRAMVMAHRAAGSTEDGHFSLVVQPPAAPPDDTVTPREIVFVVDTSSSMAGRPLEHARAVMARALGTVRRGDTFQVLAFSDRVVSLAPTPLAWSEENLSRANTFVAGIRATGSTNMVPAIEAALTNPSPDDGRLKLVVLLTDGFIGNEADVLRSIVANLGDARLYTFGIGSNTNRFLLERASEVGRGRTVVATLSEDPREVAERFARLVDKPVFTDVEIDWGGLTVSDVYPRRLPDLFAGKPLLVHGRFEGGGSAEVKIRGTVNGRRFERVIAVAFPEESADDAHAAHGTLWARAAVHERMNRIFLRDDPELIEEVTDLGLRYRMVTQYTSFVAVEERREESEEAEDGEPETQVRPTVSPARALPGDPEIRIPAPRDARAVTIILPFGETMPAAFESDLGLWTARFLIPADAEDGSYPIEVLITHADGRQERMRVWYTVDASAAELAVEVVGDATPGNIVTLRARQVITERDMIQAGLRGDAELTEARAQFLSDAREVQLRTPAGEVIDFRIAGPGLWEAEYEIPGDAADTLTLGLTIIDLAANVSSQTVDIEIVR